MDRRDFLGTSARATGALCAGVALSACTADGNDEEPATVDASAASPSSLPAVGLQLYTIRSVMENDFRGAMEQVADVGYDEVEFAGYYGRSPEEIGSLLKNLGLAAPATHISLRRIREAPGEVIQTAQAMGHQYVVCPYLDKEDRASIEDYRALADEFSAFGKRCTDAGLQFAYHNHGFEFKEMDGTVPYEVLLEETSPEHVQMEIDLYWTVDAGHDPRTYVEKNPDRYPLCHVKDRSADGEMVSVGEGTINFASIFAVGDFEHFFVEHDEPADPMQSIETSYRTLADLEM